MQNYPHEQALKRMIICLCVLLMKGLPQNYLLLLQMSGKKE